MQHTVFELRRYRLRPASRELLLSIFEREFVETQEELGIGLPAFYRDLDDPNAFVWVRSFPNMQARADALAAFYSGPVWKAHGAEANATMVNSDNVLLLRPTRPWPVFAANSPTRPPVGASSAPAGLTTITTCSLAPGSAEKFADLFEREARELIEAAGARIDGMFITEPSANTFQRLPVREGETVFVWFSTFANLPAYDGYLARLADSEAWRCKVFPTLDQEVWRAMETVRLTPTARSLGGW
ncbi:NIPSNAP family protein [Rhizobium calliandrae]|uniref:NIPSNAP family protein n=1 Tax=Rhizobium calliandrae TaxID=1312182 RepID=A0ABT7KP39_9HYPH|nr:NIPSNAP family protein [Rhizobium calliandrae]MDL2410385.1 NIPSNAP family protein [Rhizobium calliandrae]